MNDVIYFHEVSAVMGKPMHMLRKKHFKHVV